ncbi:MAG: hypothetical protein WAM28_07665 [Chlamydiales bacterium]
MSALTPAELDRSKFNESSLPRERENRKQEDAVSDAALPKLFSIDKELWADSLERRVQNSGDFASPQSKESLAFVARLRASRSKGDERRAHLSKAYTLLAEIIEVEPTLRRWDAQAKVCQLQAENLEGKEREEKLREAYNCCKYALSIERSSDYGAWKTPGAILALGEIDLFGTKKKPANERVIDIAPGSQHSWERLAQVLSDLAEFEKGEVKVGMLQESYNILMERFREGGVNVPVQQLLNNVKGKLDRAKNETIEKR